MKTYRELKIDIAEGNTKEVLQILLYGLNDKINIDEFDDIVALSARFKDLEKQEKRGLISPKAKSKGLIKINSALLYYVNEFDRHNIQLEERTPPPIGTSLSDYLQIEQNIPAPPKEGNYLIELTWDVPYNSYSEDRLGALMYQIDYTIGVDPKNRIVYAPLQGSVRIPIELPKNTARKLYWLIKLGHFENLKVTDAKMIQDVPAYYTLPSPPTFPFKKGIIPFLLLLPIVFFAHQNNTFRNQVNGNLVNIDSLERSIDKHVQDNKFCYKGYVESTLLGDSIQCLYDSLILTNIANRKSYENSLAYWVNNFDRVRNELLACESEAESLRFCCNAPVPCSSCYTACKDSIWNEFHCGDMPKEILDKCCPKVETVDECNKIPDSLWYCFRNKIIESLHCSELSDGQWFHFEDWILDSLQCHNIVNSLGVRYRDRVLDSLVCEDLPENLIDCNIQSDDASRRWLSNFSIYTGILNDQKVSVMLKDTPEGERYVLEEESSVPIEIGIAWKHRYLLSKKGKANPHLSMGYGLGIIGNKPRFRGLIGGGLTMNRIQLDIGLLAGKVDRLDNRFNFTTEYFLRPENFIDPRCRLGAFISIGFNFTKGPSD